jgi:DNA polymerase-3 subunit alpha/DNA polymerase-3 subunit epsilon
MQNIVFLDTETTGLPKFRNINALNQPSNWPDIVSVAWSVYEYNGTLIKSRYSVIKPNGWSITADSIKIHGITMEYAEENGSNLDDILYEMKKDMESCDTVIAHNIEFDKNVLFNAYKWRLNMNPWHIWPAQEICTMILGESELKIPSKYPKPNRLYKPPTLTELYEATFGEKPTGQHNSQKDVEILCKMYWKRWPYASNIV